MKVVIAIAAALSWLGALMAGASYALGGMDRSVQGLSGMLMLLLFTLAGALTGVWLRLLASHHARLGQLAWVFFAFVVLLWTDWWAAWAALSLAPLIGLWWLIQWWRAKPAPEATPPQ